MKKVAILLFLLLTIRAESSGAEGIKNVYSIDRLSGTGDVSCFLDKKKVADLLNKIKNGEFGNINSLVIIYKDSLVLEKYFRGWTRNKRHWCLSATKTFISALIGIAIQQGKIKSVDETVLSFFPEYRHSANFDELKKSITVKHLLTMTAGFEWDEYSPSVNEDGTPNFDNDFQKMNASKDWIKHVLDRPMNSRPGSLFNYNTGCAILLAGILRNTTGKSAKDFAAMYLFKPLGIKDWRWDGKAEGDWPHPSVISDDRGKVSHPNSLFLTPVDMAIFGYVYLKNGRWNGAHIIPENWVEASVQKYSEGFAGDYGYLWWVQKNGTGNTIAETTNRTIYFAFGGYGQFIFVIPPFDMVVVMTAENGPHFPGSKPPVPAARTMLHDYILPAAALDK